MLRWITSASLRAGTTATTDGQVAGSSTGKRVALAQQPETVVEQQQIEPDRQRQEAEQDARDHFRYPLSPNQASASLRPSR